MRSRRAEGWLWRSLLRSCWLRLSLSDECASDECPLAMPTWSPVGGDETIPVIVSRPSGEGPFPTVVIMHEGTEARSTGVPSLMRGGFRLDLFFVLLNDLLLQIGRNLLVVGEAHRVCAASLRHRAQVGRVPQHLRIRH
jgi:hypothetical protein